MLNYSYCCIICVWFVTYGVKFMKTEAVVSSETMHTYKTWRYYRAEDFTVNSVFHSVFCSSPPFVLHLCCLVPLSRWRYPGVHLTRACNISLQTAAVGATGSHASPASCMRTQFFTCLITALAFLGHHSVASWTAAHVFSISFSSSYWKLTDNS